MASEEFGVESAYGRSAPTRLVRAHLCISTNGGWKRRSRQCETVVAIHVQAFREKIRVDCWFITELTQEFFIIGWQTSEETGTKAGMHPLVMSWYRTTHADESQRQQPTEASHRKKIRVILVWLIKHSPRIFSSFDSHRDGIQGESKRPETNAGR